MNTKISLIPINTPGEMLAHALKGSCSATRSIPLAIKKIKKDITNVLKDFVNSDINKKQIIEVKNRVIPRLGLTLLRKEL
jgi:hypothetical protein